MSNLALKTFDYQGKIIQIRESDGYVNLTQMCQANGKRIDNFLRLKQTQDYVSVLSQSLTSEVVLSEIGGETPSTWGHPTLAINLARWISPEFAVWCDRHIFALIATGQTAIAVSDQSVELAKGLGEIASALQAIASNMGSFVETASNAVVEEATEKLNDYHLQKSLEFKRIREQNEIQRWLRRN